MTASRGRPKSKFLLLASRGERLAAEVENMTMEINHKETSAPPRKYLDTKFPEDYSLFGWGMLLEGAMYFPIISRTIRGGN